MIIALQNHYAIRLNAQYASSTTAYQLVKAFWENEATLVDKALWWESASPALLDNVSIPFHSGALRYYREVGIEVPEPAR